MKEIKQTLVFKKWESGLRDKRAKTLIATRISRLAAGLSGDAVSVGEGVSELRIHYGPGYRVYFTLRAGTFILLLAGGDKSTQAQDIAKAKNLAKKWSNHD